MKSRLLLACLLLSIAAAARADEPKPPASARPPEVPSDLQVMASPLLGESTVDPSAWTEMLLQIHNGGTEPKSGNVTAIGFSKWNGDVGNTDRAPYSVAPGATVHLRLPVRIGTDGDPGVRVTAADGRVVFEKNFSRMTHNRTMLLDVAAASPLGAQLGGVPVGSVNDPWAYHPAPGYYGGWGYTPPPYASSSASTIEVVLPVHDPATGEPLLPTRAAGYARIAAVIIRSDALVGLGATELAALTGWTLAGGTLAVIVARPEDMRHPTLTALTGGEVKKTELAVETRAPVLLGTTPSAGAYGVKPQPSDTPVPDELAPSLTGYGGGNLQPSSMGASASYGLGEVHLLAFDPQKRPAVDYPWTHVRVIDMLRRANERQTSVLFHLGEEQAVTEPVRQYLDPNESSRWGIVIAALLLCVYAVFAGPLNFTAWRRKGTPLKALPTLAIASAGTFALVVAIGVSAKGCSGRARHLTFIEAGAGMKTGAAWRWRGFFVPSARDMTVRANHAASVIGVQHEDARDEASDQLVLDNGGLRLVSVELRPWQTMVVREDGFASLGDGIALVKTSPTETTVVNRTGHPLRALCLWQPGTTAPGGTGTGDTLLLERLDNGASASSTTFVASRAWGARSFGGLAVNDYEPDYVKPMADHASENVTAAWLAVRAAVGREAGWFPADVPVLLAQIEGGEGDGSDSGLRLEHDRVLVRVVGYGGEP